MAITKGPLQNYHGELITTTSTNSGKGRYSKFTAEIAQLIERIARIGATNDQICDIVGIDKSTLKDWFRRMPEFKRKIVNAKEIADSNVTNSLYRRAIGYDAPTTEFVVAGGKVVEKKFNKHIPPDPTSMIFWLKNRRRDLWRDVYNKFEVNADKQVQMIITTVDNQAKDAVMQLK